MNEVEFTITNGYAETIKDYDALIPEAEKELYRFIGLIDSIHSYTNVIKVKMLKGWHELPDKEKAVIYDSLRDALTELKGTDIFLS